MIEYVILRGHETAALNWVVYVYRRCAKTLRNCSFERNKSVCRSDHNRLEFRYG